jgi:hypothetical protein
MSTLADIMDGLASLADPISRNNYPFPPLSVTVPCVVVGYPDSIDYDETFQRGADKFVLPVWFLVGQAGTLEVRNAVFDVLTDVASIKGLYDGNHSFGATRVTDAVIDEVEVGSLTYLGAKFSVEVIS